MKLTDRLGEVVASQHYLDALASGSKVSASLVCDQQGNFVDEFGGSRSLGGELDKQWLGALRRASEVVLTSGKTFRTEKYRMPKTADLAVLSRAGVDRSVLEPKADQRFHLLHSDGYLSALKDLQLLGYQRIHVEFGPTGIRQLIGNKVALTLWLTGPSVESLNRAAENLGCEVEVVCESVDLVFGVSR